MLDSPRSLTFCFVFLTTATALIYMMQKEENVYIGIVHIFVIRKWDFREYFQLCLLIFGSMTSQERYLI